MLDTNLLPIKAPYHVNVLHGPPGTDVGDLDCLVEEDAVGQVVTRSSWGLTDEQRAMISAGAHVRMSVWQHPIPPLGLAIEGPFCPACGQEMMFSEGRFACHVVDCHGEEGVGDDDDSGRKAEEEVRRDFIPAPLDEEGNGAGGS